MLNRALRVMDVDHIIKLGFFINDLHRHIEQLHLEQFTDQNSHKNFTIYRGQGMTSNARRYDSLDPRLNPYKHHLLLIARFVLTTLAELTRTCKKSCIIFGSDDYFVKRLSLSAFC